MENNIAPNTQVGRIVIDEKVFDKENPYLYPDYSRGADFTECLVCDNILIFSNRWLHLASFTEFLEDYKEYMEKYKICYSSFGAYERYNIQNNDGLRKISIVPIVDCRDRKSINPVSFHNRSTINPLVFLNERNRG